MNEKTDAKSFGDGYRAGYKAALDNMRNAVIEAMAKECVDFFHNSEKQEAKDDD